MNLISTRHPLLLVSLLTVFLSSCVQNVRPINISESDDSSFSPLPVFFATNRNDTGKGNLNKRYGSDRSDLTYGINTVTIPAQYPKAHQASFIHWNLPLKRNPEKYVAVVNMENQLETDFFKKLNLRIAQSDSKTALVFIHGYNVPFERATRITAKLAYDLNIDGAAVLFSWPSKASTTKYTIDEVNLAWSQPHFEHFIAQMFEQTKAKNVIFLAHSLGNRALTQGLISHLAQHPEHGKRISAVVLAAPDIDASIFARDIAPKLTQTNLPITLYVSSRDLALAASKTVHGYPRAGEAGDDILVLDGIETIDASDSEAEVFGHEYFSQGAHTITDIYQWIVEHKSPGQRNGLVAVEHANGTYWRINPEK